MSVLKGFLQPSPMDRTKEVIISERFKGEDGKPLPFKIRVIDQETNNKLYKASKITKVVKGQIIESIDNEEYSKRLVATCVVEPDFKDASLCEYYKTVNPLDVPNRMLSSGEFNRLMNAINELNEFDTPEVIEEQAKNS